MKTPRWLSLAVLLRPMKQPLAVALFLSAVVHAGVFASVLAALPGESTKTTNSMPILVVAFGDSDRLGLPVAAVAPDPGTLRQGDAETPGGDGKPKPAVEKAPAPPTPPPAPAPVPMPEKPKPAPAPVVEKPMPPPTPVPMIAKPTPAETHPPPVAPLVAAAPGKPDAPPAKDRQASQPTPQFADDSGSPGAPGGSHLPLGTPSAGGKSVGSTTGVRIADGAIPPPYPTAAREAEIEGTPVVWLRVSANGDVLVARIEKSCGHKVLDDAALQWARVQKFLPALRDGQPVEAEVTKPVRFYLY